MTLFFTLIHTPVDPDPPVSSVTERLHVGQYTGADHECEKMNHNDQGSTNAEGYEPALRHPVVKLDFHHGYLQSSSHRYLQQGDKKIIFLMSSSLKIL